MYTFYREARVQPQVGRMVVRSDHVGDPLPRRQAIQRHAKGKLQTLKPKQVLFFFRKSFAGIPREFRGRIS